MSWTLVSVGSELVSFASVDDCFSSLTCSGDFSGVVFLFLSRHPSPNGRASKLILLGGGSGDESWLTCLEG
jgi:hypothetical protein